MEKHSRYKPLSTEEGWERLAGASKILRQRERLSNAEARQSQMAVEIFNMKQPSEKQNRYKEFLYDVLSKSSPPFVLLSAIALGQARVASLTIDNRSSLISKIKENKDNTDMNHTTVQSLAIEYLIPNSVAGEFPLTLRGDRMWLIWSRLATANSKRKKKGNGGPSLFRADIRYRTQ